MQALRGEPRTYTEATEAVILAKHERTRHLAKLALREDDETWGDEFTRLQANVREAMFARVTLSLSATGHGNYD